MSRRIVAPVLLLLASALSIAMVFVVHEIESAGGPLSQPSAIPPHFSPNGDGVQDAVEISFTTKRPERITVEVRGPGGRVVDRLLDGARVDGERAVTWDGTGARPGEYRVVIRRDGDDREYQPVDPVVLDVTPPRGEIVRARVSDDGRVSGVALLEPGTDVIALDADGDRLAGRTIAPPNPDAESARPGRPVPRGLGVFLWYFDLGDVDFEDLDGPYAQDLAGNRTELHMAVALRPAAGGVTIAE